MSVEPKESRVIATGFMAYAALFLTQIALGIALSTRYVASIRSAHDSVQRMNAESAWRVATSLHYWLSALCIVVGGLIVITLIWEGWYSRETRGYWWAALLILVFTLALQMTGNLLPLSAHDVRTANIEAGIAGGTQDVGDFLMSTALGGKELGQATLDRWYFAHRWLLPIVLAITVLMAVLKIRKDKLRPIWLISVLPLAAGVVLAFIYNAPFGPPAGAADFHSGATPPMWYVMPMHALLVGFQRISPSIGWVGAMLVPLLVLIVLFCLPFIFKKSHGPSLWGRLILVVGAAGLCGAIVAWGGSPQSIFKEEAIAPETESNPKADYGPINPALAANGKAQFQKAGCPNCHSVDPAGGHKNAPNLSKVGTRQQNPRWFVELIHSPASKGRFTMPAFEDLSLTTRREIAEYLRSLK